MNVLLSVNQGLESTEYIKGLFICVYSLSEHSEILDIYMS